MAQWRGACSALYILIYLCLDIFTTPFIRLTNIGRLELISEEIYNHITGIAIADIWQRCFEIENLKHRICKGVLF